MYKKLFALFMLLSMAVVFTGCSSSNSSDGLVKTVKVQMPVSYGNSSERASGIITSTILATASLDINGVTFTTWAYTDDNKDTLMFSKVIYIDGSEDKLLKSDIATISYMYGGQTVISAKEFYIGCSTSSFSSLSILKDGTVYCDGKVIEQNYIASCFVEGSNYEAIIRFLDRNRNIINDVTVDTANGWEILVEGKEVNRQETITAEINNTKNYLSFEKNSSYYTINAIDKTATYEEVNITIKKFLYTYDGKNWFTYSNE